jgi:hypothetical protein
MARPLSTANPTPGALISNRCANSLSDISPPARPNSREGSLPSLSVAALPLKRPLEGPYKLPKINILLANNGFVPILESLPTAIVSSIKIDNLSCKQSSHELGKGGSSGSEKKMGMIWHESPCVADRFRLWQQCRQTLEKIFAILITEKYLTTLYPSDHDMRQYTRSIQSG